MIGLSIEFDGRDKANFDQLSRQFPREMVRANGFAASIVKRKFRAEMKKGGGKDIPSFVPPGYLTAALGNGVPLGGKLAGPGVIVSYKRGDAQIVGWVDGLADLGSIFQSEESRPTTGKERMMFHRRGLSGVSGQPSWYSRPARPVTGPLIKAVAPEYPRWFQGAAEKLIGKTLAKAGFK